VTFADLEKKIHPAKAVPVAAVPAAPVHRPTPPVNVVERELRRVDLLLLATGLCIFVVGVAGDYFSTSVHDYAWQWVMNTLVCEMYLLWLAMGAWLASDKPVWLRVPIMIGTICLYLLVITHDAQFSLAPQAAWVLCLRLLPPGFVGVFTNANVIRVQVITLSGLAVLVLQVIIFALSSAALAGLGVATVKGHEITTPSWLSGLVWGAYYIELAFYLPYVERNMDRSSSFSQR
jgi:hypothetical protein